MRDWLLFVAVAIASMWAVYSYGEPIKIPKLKIKQPRGSQHNYVQAGSWVTSIGGVSAHAALSFKICLKCGKVKRDKT